MSSDEQFETWLREAARSYHRPPEVPREAMWAEIRDALDKSSVPGAVAEGAANESQSHSRPPTSAQSPERRSRELHRRWRGGQRYAALAVAAVALVAVGIQVGRRWSAPASDVTVATGRPDVANGSEGTYAAAAAEHLESAEILLASLRSASPLDSAVGAWARALLSDTRLLLGSPAATDPGRRRLLEDLELTLVQLVQLGAATTDDDRYIVRRSIERGSLLTRLRTAAPPGRSGT